MAFTTCSVTGFEAIALICPIEKTVNEAAMNIGGYTVTAWKEGWFTGLEMDCDMLALSKTVVEAFTSGGTDEFPPHQIWPYGGQASLTI